MKRLPVTLFMIGMLAACSTGESWSVNQADIEVLRAVVAPGCEREDGKYVVLSSQPASDERWTIPEAWEEGDRISAELRRRAESQLKWPSVDLCPGVRFADAAAIDSTFERDSRKPAGWDNFYQQFPGSSGFVKVSLPAFTSAGDHAVVLVESGCGLLCGQGLYIELRKEQDAWKVSRLETAWIA